MEDPAPAPESSPWQAGDFVLPLFLLMPTIDAASIYGDQAATLHIAGAGFVKSSPSFMLAAAIFTPALLHGTRLSRWRQGITAAVIFLCLMSAPWLLKAGSSSIPLSRWLSHEEAPRCGRLSMSPACFAPTPLMGSACACAAPMTPQRSEVICRSSESLPQGTHPREGRATAKLTSPFTKLTLH